MEVSLPMNIAQHVISKVGGVSKVAAICGRTTSWVYKWTYPKERSGRGGVVPHEDAEALLAAARRGEIELSPADFFIHCSDPSASKEISESQDIPTAAKPSGCAAITHTPADLSNGCT